MTPLPDDVVQPRPRRGLRGVTIAVVAAGAVLLPASAALANHMPGMNGTMCPHASGEGPNALAPPGPNEPAAPAQAPSSGPVSAVSAPRASAPATEPAATNPTQVTQPATQVPYQQPATVAESVEAAASAAVSAAVTTIAAPRLTRAERLQLQRERAEARQLRRQSRAAERSFVRTYAVEPFSLARTLVGVSERPVASAPSRGIGLIWLVPVLIAVAAFAAALLARRRDSGAAVTADERPAAPVTPSYADAAMEAELHEIIAEARARELLGADADSEAVTSR